jgi:hypothetical protein
MNEPNRPAKNRRLTMRWPPKGPPEVACFRGALGLGANIAVSVLDISESGIRLVVKVPLKNGEEVEINLTPPGVGKPFRIMADIAWCVATSDGKHCVGARFQKYMSYADLQRLT